MAESDELAYIRQFYRVPARIGGRVRFESDGRQSGTLIGHRGAFLKVRVDGWAYPAYVHPAGDLEYLPDDASQPAE